jgi:hypothetical protein
VNGTFQIQNVGDTGSLLNWTINTSSISWGTWSFNPGSGVNLTPADGQVTVLATVVSPDEPESEFEGYLRVENIDDPTDFDIIPVSLTTPVDTHNAQKITYQSLLHMIQHHSLISNLLFLKTFFRTYRFL